MKRGRPGLQRLDDAVGDRHRRHLGREVVGRDVAVRRHQPALLARERLLDAAVEEVGHVRVLLGLGGAQLRHAALGQHLAQDHRQALGRERRRHVDLGVVLGHGRERRQLRPRRAIEVREVAVARVQRQRELARPVGAEVVEEAGVAVLDHRARLAVRRPCAASGITNSSVSGLASPRSRARRRRPDRRPASPRRASASSRRSPAAPSACRDPSRSSGRPPTPARPTPISASSLADLAQVAGRRLGRRVAPVEERVPGDVREPAPLGQLADRVGVLERGVHVARAGQTEQVQRAAARLGGVDRRDQRRVVVERCRPLIALSMRTMS